MRLECQPQHRQPTGLTPNPRPHPNASAAYKGSSDLFIDSNLQLAVAAAKQVSSSRQQA